MDAPKQEFQPFNPKTLSHLSPFRKRLSSLFSGRLPSFPFSKMGLGMYGVGVAEGGVGVDEGG